MGCTEASPAPTLELGLAWPLAEASFRSMSPVKDHIPRTLPPALGGPTQRPGASRRPDVAPATSPSGDQPDWFWGAGWASRGSYAVATELRKAAGPRCLVFTGSARDSVCLPGRQPPKLCTQPGRIPEVIFGKKGISSGTLQSPSPCVLRAQNSGRRGDGWH